MPSGLWERRARITMAGMLMAPLVFVACQDDDGPALAASEAPPTSAIESRDPAVATTTIGRPSGATPEDAGPVDGARLCDLLQPADLLVLGPNFAPEAGPAGCSWTEPDSLRTLAIDSTMLHESPLSAMQQYLGTAGHEPVEAPLDIADGLVVMVASTVETMLVVFTGDVRLDFDVPSGRETAVDLAKKAVHRLGPRRAVPANP